MFFHANVGIQKSFGKYQGRIQAFNLSVSKQVRGFRITKQKMSNVLCRLDSKSACNRHLVSHFARQKYTFVHPNIYMRV